jgi:hypothetical protein
MPLYIIYNLNQEKPSFGPSKWPRMLKTAKNSKLPKFPENCFEPVGKGGWPPIYTSINTPSLGINGLDQYSLLRKQSGFDSLSLILATND